MTKRCSDVRNQAEHPPMLTTATLRGLCLALRTAVRIKQPSDFGTITFAATVGTIEEPDDEVMTDPAPRVQPRLGNIYFKMASHSGVKPRQIYRFDRRTPEKQLDRRSMQPQPDSSMKALVFTN